MLTALLIDFVVINTFGFIVGGSVFLYNYRNRFKELHEDGQG
jgi:hypothetical protein